MAVYTLDKTGAQIDAILNAMGSGDLTWYSGEVSSVRAPLITADGDLTTSTDQVPSYWRIVVNPSDNVSAAQALLNGTPNVTTLQLGKAEIIEDTSGNQINSVAAICVSTAGSRPSDFVGGAYIMSGVGSTLADVLANMAVFDFTGAVGVQFISANATSLYNTNYSDLIVSGAVLS